MENKEINKSVRYDHFGHSDVYYIADLEKPSPKAGEVLVKVKFAGINPGEASIREGILAKQFPSTFPSGQGSDFAGIIESVGDGVSNFKPGEEVIGFSNNRNSHAQFVAVQADQVTTRAAGVSWEQAGGLFVAGSTAYAALKAVDVKAGDTLVVSSAAGGVGSVIVQLAKANGINVIGIASASNHEWLEKHGLTPVDYKGDIKENLLQVLGNKKADAFIDTHGKGYVAMAIGMGIPPEKIDTIIDFEAVEKYKVKAEGSANAATAAVLAELAKMIDEGKLDIPIAKTYPLSEVKAAYDDLAKRHTRGKIVLQP